MKTFAREQAFQTLIQSLPFHVSSRMRVLRICEFLEELILARDTSSLEAYAPELLQELVRNFPTLQAEGTPTAFFDRLLGVLERLESLTPAAYGPAEWAWMRELPTSYRKHSLRFSVDRQVNRLWEHPSLKQKHSASVWVPVVETEPMLPHLPPRFALLRELTIEFSSTIDATRSDRIFLDQSVDPEGKHHEVIKGSLQVAREMLVRRTGKTLDASFNVHCRFNEPNIIVGESMGMAAAVAALSEFLRVSESRYHVSLSSRVAFTGSLDSNGKILPIDEAGLLLKLEACIYSHVSYVVLPRSQLAFAEEYYASPPHEEAGTLPVLIGVNRLDDILLDRRITHVLPVPLHRMIARRVWARRGVIAASLIVVLGSILAYVLFAPLDVNPQFAEFRGKWLIVRNRYHATLAQYEVGEKIVRAQQDEEGRTISTFQFLDVDGDGINEVLYEAMLEGRPSTVKLVCRSIRKEGVHWEKAITRHLTFPKSPEIESEEFNVAGFQAGEFSGTGRPEIILLANHTFFPSLIMKIDARTGREIGEYLHIGQLADFTMADLDGDGVTEVIACGVNNAFRKAALIILDPRTIEGCSPTRGDYVPDPYTPGKEEGYLLLPRTIAAEAVGPLTSSNGAVAIDIDHAGRKIVVRVVDFHVPLPQFGTTSHGDLIYYFDFSLRPLRVGSATNYDLMAERMVQNGWLKKVPDGAYFEKYLASIQRWDGTRFIENLAK